MAADMDGRNAQIAVEFIVVYSFVLIVFLVFFALIASQRATTLSEQEYASMQLVAQNVAGYIDEAVASGSGFNATIALPSTVGAIPYNLSISTTGVVIASVKVGGRITRATAFSAGRNLFINGTLLSSVSGNGINIYSIPTFTDILTIANSGGSVYVDEAAPQTGGLTGRLMVQQIWDEKAATFNGAAYPSNTYIQIPPLIALNGHRSFTVSTWLDYLGGAQYASQNQYPVGWPGCHTGFEFAQSSGDIMGAGFSDWYTTSATAGPGCPSPGTPINPPFFSPMTPGTMHMLTAAYNLTTGVISFYVDGSYYGNAIVPAGDYLGNYTETGYIGDILDGSTNANFFNGSVANLQIYNRSLPASEIGKLYSEGMGGAPVNSTQLAAWYRLNGDTLDYSGNANTIINPVSGSVVTGFDGVPVGGVSYNTVAQFQALGFTYYGSANTMGHLFGVEASAGAVGTSNVLSTIPTNALNYTPMYFSASGANSIFVTLNGVVAGANLIVTAFNGNTATQGNLIGWWPLNEGSGNFIHDLSGQYNNGISSNLAWVNLTNYTSFSPARFAGDIAGCPCPNSGTGWITTSNTANVLNGYNSIISNNTFTVSAWVYENGYDTSHMQGIAGNQWYSGLCPSASPQTGFQLALNTFGQGPIALLVASQCLDAVTYNVIPGNWMMVTGEYSGRTGIASIFLNGIPDNSASIGSGLPLTENGPFVIGNDGWSVAGSGGFDTFNGMITNVQLYSTTLTQSQVSYLYGQGATGAPLQNAGLVDWWPVDGNTVGYASDYGPGRNPGAISGNVVFNSIWYGNYTVQNPVSVPRLDGKTSYVKLSQQPQLANGFTFAAWVRDESSSITFDVPQEIFNNNQFFLRIEQYSENANHAFAAFVKLSGGSVEPRAQNNAQFTALNTWYFVAATWNTVTLSLYVNGNLDASSTRTGALTSTTAEPDIGRGEQTNPNSNYFNGTIADVQIYNSVLTPLQIGQLYEQGLPPSVTLNVSS